MEKLIFALLYVLFAPLLGALLAGTDRIITARMQNRVGPPVLQPFYDVYKLWNKASSNVNRLQGPLILCHLLFMAFTGALFFFGADILLVIFTLTVAAVFFILAAYSSNSPFSFIGAERELILVLACEPMLLLALAGIYKVAQSFNLYEIVDSGKPLILYLPGIFLGFAYLLTAKFRKSPFDISYSHHAHQELVKGITTDLSGPTLAMVEISHWYENILLLGFVYLFFSFSPILGIVVALLTYFLEILIDNTHARVKWQAVLGSTWAITLILGGGNLLLLYLIG